MNSSRRRHQNVRRHERHPRTDIEADGTARGGGETDLVLEQTLRSDDLLENVLADVTVDGAQRVVEEVEVPVGVDGARQADALLLTAAQVDTLPSTPATDPTKDAKRKKREQREG